MNTKDFGDIGVATSYIGSDDMPVFSSLYDLAKWCLDEERNVTDDIGLLCVWRVNDDGEYEIPLHVLSGNVSLVVEGLYRAAGPMPAGAGICFTGAAYTYDNDKYSFEQINRLNEMGISPKDVSHKEIRVAQVFEAVTHMTGTLIVEEGSDEYSIPAVASETGTSMGIAGLLAPLIGDSKNRLGINIFADNDKLVEAMPDFMKAVGPLSDIIQKIAQAIRDGVSDDFETASLINEAREVLIASGHDTSQFDEVFPPDEIAERLNRDAEQESA